MRYLSLFSGIGGFEYAIHEMYPNAVCVGHSEIDPYAISIYSQHYSNHLNLGDITKLTKQDDIPECDLIVGGFPCTNLSRMANFRGDKRGLAGAKSNLFYDMVRVIKLAMRKNPETKFIIENNESMKRKNREQITSVLEKNFGQVFLTHVNCADFGIQTRRRILWTNFEVDEALPSSHDSAHETTSASNPIQTWEDVLDDKNTVKEYALSDAGVNCLNKLLNYKNPSGKTRIACKKGDVYYFRELATTTQKSRWDIQRRSDTADEKCRPITAGSGGGNNIVLDRRFGTKPPYFLVRKFTVNEIERLFGFPTDYTLCENKPLSETRRKIALGNSIPVFIVKYILKDLS